MLVSFSSQTIFLKKRKVSSRSKGRGLSNISWFTDNVKTGFEMGRLHVELYIRVVSQHTCQYAELV